MALNNAAVADIGFASLVGAESMKLHAYSAFTLLFMMNSGTDPKAIRKHLAVRAAETGVIAKNTWESYVKGVETASGMFRQHAPDEVATIFDMGADEAVDAVRALYEGLNILSGSDIRAWATAGVFEPLDKAAAKAAKAAKAAAAKEAALAKGTGAAALFFAGNATDSSTISDMGSAAPVDPIAAIAALLAGLDEAATMKALEAVNARLATMQAAKDAAPAPDKIAPVLADDATVAKLSSLGRVKHAA